MLGDMQKGGWGKKLRRSLSVCGGSCLFPQCLEQSQPREAEMLDLPMMFRARQDQEKTGMLHSACPGGLKEAQFPFIKAQVRGEVMASP